MNKLPAKQIYLLAVIIIGIIALSVYSTYALFTFESTTSDIVSIHTPKSLKISENIYEYQQITIDANTITTTDIDIYNTFDYDVCYSIWYKIVGDDIDTSKIQLFETGSETLTSSGVLIKNENIRITIAIINDNEESIKINLGTIGAKKENDSCSLNLAADKNQINQSYKEIKTLSGKIYEERELVKEETANYLTYKDQNETITYKETEKVYTSNKFTYDKEMFTLEDPKETTIEEIIDKIENEDIYFCKATDKCSILYKITTIEKEERIIEEQVQNNNEPENEEEIQKEIYYHITKYDKLIGYQNGNNGLRRINEKDYVFYGDNPNNYVYYNCETDNVTTCELWRIIGLFYNDEINKYNVKIVRNESIGAYQIDANPENDSLKWTNSNLYTYLNEEYKLKSKYHNIEEYSQSIETLLSLDDEIKIQEDETISKVNLLNLSDYIHASSCEKTNLSEYTDICLTNNWLNNIEISSEWTSTLKELEIVEENTEIIENQETINESEPEIESEFETEETIEDEKIIEEENKIVNYAYAVGSNITENIVDTSLDIRPVVYLKSRTLLLGGEGTFTSPYIIK